MKKYLLLFILSAGLIFTGCKKDDDDSSGNTPTPTPTAPAAPVATAATNITQASFDANWNTSTGATGYYLDVATDAGFTTFVTGYDNLDVGNVTTKNVTGLSSRAGYYYRLRSYNAVGTSGNSNVINSTSTPPIQGTMTCKVNGTAWTASLAVVATENGAIVSVSGSDSNAHQLQINVTNFSGIGTYQLGGPMTNTNAGRWTEGIGQDQTYSTMLGMGTGTFEVTDYGNNMIKGTFSFTAKNMTQVEVSITDGIFEATFQ